MVEHLAQQLYLTQQCGTAAVCCIGLLQIVAGTVVGIRIAQGTIHPLELGGVDAIAAEVVSACREQPLVDGAEDGRAIATGELGCRADPDLGHGAYPCSAMACNVACGTELADMSDTGQWVGREEVDR